MGFDVFNGGGRKKAHVARPGHELLCGACPNPKPSKQRRVKCFMEVISSIVGGSLFGPAFNALDVFFGQGVAEVRHEKGLDTGKRAPG